MRQLLIVRHAIAEAQASGDAQRALTERGRSRMERAAAGLVRIVPAIEAIYSSPLLRAVQTARILRDAYGEVPVHEEPLLEPGGGCEQVTAWIDRLPHLGTVALVGHEPDCSALTGWWIAGREIAGLRFRKGGACLLSLPEGATVGHARLEWLATPRMLRRAAG